MYKNIVVPFRNFKLRTFTASMTDIIYVCFEAIALHTECVDLNGSESITYEGVGYRISHEVRGFKPLERIATDLDERNRTSHEVRGFKYMIGVHFYRTPYGVR